MKKHILPALMFAASIVLFGVGEASAQTASAACVNLVANLSAGSRGTAVTQLQIFLHTNGFLPDQATGYFGSHTTEAVKSFQSSSMLPVVGTVGPLTRAFLQKITCAPQGTTINEPVQNTTSPTVVVTATPPAATTTTTATASSTSINLPYKTNTFTDWQPAWGNSSTTESGTLLLQGSLQNNGAEATLPTSVDWSDYRYQADLSVTNGNVSLIARYADSNNFISCGFSKNWVEIDQVYNGSSTVLAYKSVDGILQGQDGQAKTTSLALDVKGNQVGCAGYGPEDNITATLPSGSPMKGGIGIESWYGSPLADKLELLAVKVTPL